MTESVLESSTPSQAAALEEAVRLPVEQLQQMYRTMYLIRRVEESLLELAESGKIGGAIDRKSVV